MLFTWSDTGLHDRVLSCSDGFYLDDRKFRISRSAVAREFRHCFSCVGVLIFTDTNVRRTYKELEGNHIRTLRAMTRDFASYNSTEKLLTFSNGSTIEFMYCARDADLDKLQGLEYDVIFLDEATQLSEYQMRTITATLRGVNDFPKRVYYTCNPGGQGHQYIKRLFIDKQYKPGENPEERSMPAISMVIIIPMAMNTFMDA